MCPAWKSRKCQRTDHSCRHVTRVAVVVREAAVLVVEVAVGCGSGHSMRRPIGLTMLKLPFPTFAAGLYCGHVGGRHGLFKDISKNIAMGMCTTIVDIRSRLPLRKRRSLNDCQHFLFPNSLVLILALCSPRPDSTFWSC